MLRRVLVTVISLSFSTVMLAGAAPVQPAGGSNGPGLAVGAKAPAFTLVGQDGQEYSLAALRQRGKLVLLFQRSPDW